jgi:hypothetical protein
MQAMAKCLRDHRLFALYIELGGAAIDACIEYFTSVMRSAKPCMDRELQSEQEEWAKHEKNPEYRPRRVRPTITTREAMRAVNGTTKAMAARNNLMREAVEAASNGMVAQEVFIKRALKAFLDCQNGITSMPMGSVPAGDCTRSPENAGGTRESGVSAASEAGVPPASGPEAHPTKAGAATPNQVVAA